MRDRLFDSDDAVTIWDSTVPSLVAEVNTKQYEDHSFEQLRAILSNMIYGRSILFSISIYIASTKMYRNIKEIYWWPGMKKDIIELYHSVLIVSK